MSLFTELKRRNVFRVAIAYLAGAWLLIEVTETLFPIYGLSDAAIRLVVTLLAIGFPILLIFSWVFELTPEGLMLEKDIDRSVSVTHHTSKKLDRAIIVLLALALGYFSFDKFVLEPARDVELVEETAQQTRSDVMLESYGDNSIAVLAFADMSPEGDQEYFSDGISEELLNLLSKVPDLRVISRSSSFTFKGKDIDIPTIAEQLNVAYILEGSVRKAGNQVRITAQLIEAHSDTHLWSETYDRELENIFLVQDEISAAIVGVLKEQLGLQVESAPQVIAMANTEAYEAIMRGRYLMAQRTRVTIEGAVREFEKAVALDPNSALAHAELSMAILMLSNDPGYGNLTRTEAIARSAPHAERALALNQSLAETHAAKGLLLKYQGNLEEAQAHYRQATKINPNYSIVYNWMGAILNNHLGLYAESFPMHEIALQLDPLSIVAMLSNISALTDMNRLDEADRELEKLAAIAPAKYASARGALTARGGQWANMILADLDALRIRDPETVQLGWLASEFATIGLEKEAITNPGAPRPTPYVLSLLGRPADAVTSAEAWLIEISYARDALGLALAGAGEYVRARPILEETWQRSGRRVTRQGMFRIRKAAALIAIRRDADADTDVSELIEAISDNVRRYREAGIIGPGITGRPWLMFDVDYEEGLAAYLAGDRMRGLALIAKAVERGFYIPPYEAYLQVLYDDPGFAPIREMQEARQIRERNKFLTIVCTDNPYEDVWQPSEGTCEQFAAEGVN